MAAELVVDDAVTRAARLRPAHAAAPSAAPAVHVTGTIPVGTGNDDAYCTANPVTLSCLSAGKHRVFVRGLDNAGLGNWGVISDVLLNLPKVGPAVEERIGRARTRPTGKAASTSPRPVTTPVPAAPSTRPSGRLDTLAAAGQRHADGP